MQGSFLRLYNRLEILKKKSNANNDLKCLIDDIKTLQAECHDACHEKSLILYSVAGLMASTLKEMNK